MDELGMDATMFRTEHSRRKIEESTHTLSNSAIDTTDVVAERNPMASKLEYQ